MLEKTYQPRDIEKKWIEFWEKGGVYKPQGDGEPYCIVLPPPNVTGTLHMGHGFQISLMDALIRRQRMLGKCVLWQPGTDHASIATQMVVERQLAQEGQSRHGLGREKFLERVNQWSEQSGAIITQQIRRMGASLDWERTHFSMDAAITRATYAAFIRLFDDGLIYKGKRLVNWDPHLHTAISDLEVSTETTEGHLWFIRYPIVNNSNFIVVATTRPETLFGDVAVAVNPEDLRYKDLIGKTLELPLTGRQIPVIGDASVDPEFGTGCVKITPAHDFKDYETGKRHHLPLINIFTPSADCNDNVPPAYRGLGRFAARKQVVADLEAQGLIEKIEKYTIQLPRGDRSGVILEPLLTDQWFLRMDTLAKPAIAVAEQDILKFIPHNWLKTYLQWLNQIEDWCISRQLWWGHRIPVWYDENNQAYAGYDEQDVRQRYKLKPNIQLRQDEDVLDTWFTAGLWPFSSLEWPTASECLDKFYPNNVLVTGFDIIFFWVARMVIMGLKLMDDVPFKEVYITGLVRDSHGHKMSKSKGNILDPIDLMDGVDLDLLIKKRTTGLMQPQMATVISNDTKKEFPQGISPHGADALRFTFCALATTGRDINFDMNRIGGYRNFCNKLWNAARFVLMNTQEFQFNKEITSKLLPNLWIKGVLHETIQKINQAFENYRFDLIAHSLYEFIWNEYCDWYLEFVKCILNDVSVSEIEKTATKQTLLIVLETILRLSHPLIPFITEEIWQVIAPMIQQKNTDSIMTAPYPAVDPHEKEDERANQTIEWIKQVIVGIRNIRGEMNIPPSKNIIIYLQKGTQKERQFFTEGSVFIKSLAKISEIFDIDVQKKLPGNNAHFALGDLEIFIPLDELIDKAAEKAHIQKEIEKIQKALEKSNQKLNNPEFMQKAPAIVVEKEEENYNQLKLALEKLNRRH